jgi:aldose 1-epimerase
MEENMGISKREFGITKTGEKAYLYEITNENNMKAVVTDFGAILVELHVPDDKGITADVVLGYDVLDNYYDNWPGYGSIIGRNANRVGKAKFTFNGKEYTLDKNDGENSLHSGFNGYNTRLWKASLEEDKNAVSFELFSEDMDQGYPGNLNIKVTYTLTDDNAIRIDYLAKSDADTIVNMTNHSYFNLSGHNSGTALKHEVFIDAAKFTFADEHAIPSGEIRDVKDTPFDFNVMKPVAQDIKQDYDQLVWGKGYDRNFILNAPSLQEPVARVFDEASGRIMEVFTNSPGLQFYSGNYLDGSGTGKEGCEYHDYDGLAFEAQFPPNAVNIPEFDQPVLKAGDEYNYTTIYKFTNYNV